MKKIFAILVILCLCITCFVACRRNDSTEANGDAQSQQSSASSSKQQLTSEELESFWGGVSIEIDVGSNTSSTDNNSSTVTDTSSNTTTSTTSSNTSTTTSTTQSSSSNAEEEIPDTSSNITNSRNPQDIGWGPWV